MDRLRDIEVFLAIARAGSLAGAARRLHMSAPAVTRALGRLEDRLGTALILRTSRSLSLTPAGETYARHARTVVDAFDTADAAVTHSARTLRGTLTVTAPLMFGRLAVAPTLASFCATYPEVSGRLILLDRVTRFLDEGIDLGIRIGQLPDSSLIAHRLGTVRQRLVASPGYLDRFGVPAAPEALHAHRLIAFTGQLREGRARLTDGRTILYVPVHIEVDCAATAVALAASGAGITICYSYQCAEEIARGELTPVLEEVMPDPVPVQFVWPERPFESILVRAYVDHAADGIQARLSR